MLASLLMWLWLDLTRADYTRCTKKNAKLKQLCTEKWYRIPFDHCAGLIRNYKKRLVEGQPVIKSKGTHTFSTSAVNVCGWSFVEDQIKFYDSLCK